MDGTIIYAAKRIDVVLRGRELDFEVGYKLKLDGAAHPSANMLLQLEPGHVQDGSPPCSVAFKSGSRCKRH